MFTGSLFKSRSRRQTQQQRNKRTRFDLACEPLEGRQLLSGTPQILSIGTVYDSLSYGTTLGFAINPPPIQDANGHAVPGTFDFKNGLTDVTDTVLNVGHYDLSVTFNPDDTIDYSSVTTTASIDITKAKIAIVADSYEKTYGSSNPTLTDTIYADLGPVYRPRHSARPAKRTRSWVPMTWPRLPTPTPWVTPLPPAPTPTCSPSPAITTSTRHKSAMAVPVPPVTSS